MNPQRFLRTRMLFGDDGMNKLRLAHIAVVGLGAVGSYTVEALARSGIGYLRLVDFDDIRETNINRQLYATDSTLGKRKVDVARKRVLDINPGIHVETLPLFADAQTLSQILLPPVSILIDAIDSVGPKIELLSGAVQAGISVISSMGAATRTDPLAIRVGDISETTCCPLARFVRKRLKRRKIHSNIRCIYSLEPTRSTKTDLQEEQEEEESFTRGRIREPLGSFSCLTGMFGLMAAREAIMQIVES